MGICETTVSCHCCCNWIKQWSVNKQATWFDWLCVRAFVRVHTQLVPLLLRILCIAWWSTHTDVVYARIVVCWLCVSCCACLCSGSIDTSRWSACAYGSDWLCVLHLVLIILQGSCGSCSCSRLCTWAGTLSCVFVWHWLLLLLPTASPPCMFERTEPITFSNGNLSGACLFQCL